VVKVDRNAPEPNSDTQNIVSGPKFTTFLPEFGLTCVFQGFES